MCAGKKKKKLQRIQCLSYKPFCSHSKSLLFLVQPTSEQVLKPTKQGKAQKLVVVRTSLIFFFIRTYSSGLNNSDFQVFDLTTMNHGCTRNSGCGGAKVGRALPNRGVRPCFFVCLDFKNEIRAWQWIFGTRICC